MRWGSIFEKVWKHRGREREEMIPVEKVVGRYKTRVEKKTKKRRRKALRSKAKSEKHLEIHRGLSEMIGMKA